MHYHCEIVIPPTSEASEDYIQAAVAAVMSPFDENRDDKSRGSAFWDWYVIGGRWAGRKAMERLDEAKLKEFHAWMEKEGVTVSGVQFGKQELSPADQIPKVDAKWNEFFPEVAGHCPIFRHSGDSIRGDVCLLQEVPPSLSCERVIFAGQSFTKGGTWNGPLEPKFMLCDSMWNGVNHMKTAWDGTFAAALAMYRDSFGGYRDEYREAIAPREDWLAVTVDYHS